MSIKKLKVTADLRVSGVVNTNGSTGLNKKDGNDNVIYAKTFATKSFDYKDSKGTLRTGFKTVDFTSSGALRNAMFKSLDPFQLLNKDNGDLYLDKLASPIGLLRGVMTATRQLKRKSPITILDAVTTEELKPTHEARRSTAPNEEEKTSTNFFGIENYGPRIQKFEMVINLMELQFLNLDEEYGSIIDLHAVEEFVAKLNKYFEDNGVEGGLTPKNYKLKTGFVNKPIRGILLSQAQMKHLVDLSLELAGEIFIYKAGASLEIGELNIQTNKGSGIVGDFHVFYVEA
jgi:hypothetical protein